MELLTLELMELRKTINTIFMVPTLKIPREKLRDNGFINGYESDGGQEIPYPNAVYLLFKPKDLHAFKAFLDEEYERTTNIIDDYDIGNGFVVVVYKLDKRYEYDFKLIRLGKYSKTSQDFKNEFNKTVRIQKDGKSIDEVTLQYRIFNRTQDLINFWEDKMGTTLDKHQEVWVDYDYDREVLTSVKLQQYV